MVAGDKDDRKKRTKNIGLVGNPYLLYSVHTVLNMYVKLAFQVRVHIGSSVISTTVASKGANLQYVD